MTPTAGFLQYNYTYKITGLSTLDKITIKISAFDVYYWSWSVTEIKSASINYGSSVQPVLHLPEMSQTDFIKTVCNLFALIPDATAKQNKIKFYSFQDVFNNIPFARDWSNYLSEHADEAEFKFGDYAQTNYLKYKESDDVIKGTGIGVFSLEDETLQAEKDAFTLSFAATDEVIILTDQNVSRINMNKYNEKDTAYKSSDKIDPRICYLSEATGKTIGFRDTLSGGTSYDVANAMKVTGISLSALIDYYGPLKKLLTKTLLRRAKFNLPVYEVAGLNHEIPIYLHQYKAYFYVNKISNYVAGKLCTVELIKI